ncbi:hypothetical protein CI610_03006 [invertebrate metagenome]|uniref:Spore protein YkvP/CgeB glycosyl transferase-like domain-containing protein n=1 Tax=invertebrate metagenome TaxID=1711999 RepID=A0A2H9T4D1_9ZZZZ
MNVLMLVQADHGSTAFEAMYHEFSKQFDSFDCRWMTSENQANLKDYFNDCVDVNKYDRIVCFLRFKKEIKQVGFIRTIPNLVILEYDACQNYMEDSKYKGRFSRHYSCLPWARIISTGYSISKQLRKEGFDAVFFPKGYDGKIIKNLGLYRDIELGFVGNTRSKTYQQRKVFLEDMVATEGLTIAKTDPGEAYNQMLNRIRYFISADIGIGEYMQKNVEAMAAGCVVFSWDQGEEENAALGFQDMVNIVLYCDKTSLLKKLSDLKRNPDLAQKVALNGQKLAEEKFTYKKLGRTFSEYLSRPLRHKKVTSRFFFKKYEWEQ